jgi:hypothetical protein
MNAINEFNIEPGTYQHYKGGLYVVTDLLTHMDNPATGKMEPLTDPLVVYRDLEAIVKHVNGRPSRPHVRYARPLSEFTGMVVRDNEQPVKRFTKL